MANEGQGHPTSSFTSSNWLLFLVASTHLFAALSHFLFSVVSKYVARDIHYGDLACVPLPHSNATLELCNVATSNDTCENIVFGDGGRVSCVWDYTGLGYDYQLLAGPSFMTVYTTTSILWGLVADKYNRIHLLVCCTCIFSVGMTLTAYTEEFWHLVILRMILAFGVAGISPIVPGMIFDAFTEKHRGVAMSFFHWGIYLGGGLSNAIGKSVTDLHIFAQGWRGAFLVAGIPGIVLGGLMLLTGEDPPRTHKGKENPSRIHLGHASGTCPPRKSRKLHVKIQEVFDNDDDQEEIVEYETSEAHVLIEQEDCSKKSAKRKNIHFSLWNCCFDPPVLLLGAGACIRQAAGYTWGYNSALYYQTYYPDFNASWWLTWITIFGGSIGVIFGGHLSDRLISTRLGFSARPLVLAGSQFLSFPFALGTLWFDPPSSFFSLLIGYFFAEMWYGVLFATLVELLPSSIRSLGMAVALFIINNFGGNIPILVTPLKKAMTYRTALTMLYPGSLLLSSLLFLMAFISISRK